MPRMHISSVKLLVPATTSHKLRLTARQSLDNPFGEGRTQREPVSPGPASMSLSVTALGSGRVTLLSSPKTVKDGIAAAFWILATSLLAPSLCLGDWMSLTAMAGSNDE
eukprot:scaffold1371_cov400-Prasinococcus_capsulatus_cf.AAC.8